MSGYFDRPKAIVRLLRKEFKDNGGRAKAIEVAKTLPNLKVNKKGNITRKN